MFWIDVTDTFLNWSGSPTGIQRTLLGLAEASKQRDDCALCAWDREKNLWREIPVDQFTRIFSEDSSCGQAKESLPSKQVAFSGTRGILNFSKKQTCLIIIFGSLRGLSFKILLKI